MRVIARHKFAQIIKLLEMLQRLLISALVADLLAHHHFRMDLQIALSMQCSAPGMRGPRSAPLKDKKKSLQSCRIRARSSSRICLLFFHEHRVARAYRLQEFEYAAKTDKR